MESEDKMRLAMVYHENGGNESFEIKGGAMDTLKGASDSHGSHTQLVFVRDSQDLDAARAVEFSHDSSGAARVASTRPPASAGPAGVSSPTAPPDPVAACREAAARETGWPVVRYVSLFAGVEAFSVASSRIAGARWEPVFFSEIDPFPCAVLAHRFPGVPNLGDVSKIKVRETADGRKEITNGGASVPFPAGGIDILAGGSPCQDVSLAGLRRGFADGTRSSLAFEYARLVGELRPRVLLWENVVGVLSSRGGRDFAALLRRLDELGYGLAWRVLDVQWTRVDGPMPGGGWGGFPRAIPQRRERVWLVGLAGAPGTSAAEILFERYGVPGHTPPRREAGKGFAAPPGYCPALAAAPRGGAGVGRGFDLLAFGRYGEGGAASTVKALDYKDATDLVAEPTAPPLSAPPTAADSADKAPRGGSSPSRSASFDGMDCAPTLHRPNGSPGQSDQEIFSQGGHTSPACGRQVVTMAKELYNAGERQAGGLGIGTDGAAPCLRADDHPAAVALRRVGCAVFENHAQDSRVREMPDVSPTQGAQLCNAPANNPLVVTGLDLYNDAVTGDVSKTQSASASDFHHAPCVLHGINCNASLEFGALPETAQTLTVCHRGGGSGRLEPRRRRRRLRLRLRRPPLDPTRVRAPPGLPRRLDAHTIPRKTGRGMPGRPAIQGDGQLLGNELRGVDSAPPPRRAPRLAPRARRTIYH